MRLITCFVALSLCLLAGACEFNNGNGDIDIDIGDYEDHLEAWNNQNMLEYQLNVGSWSSRPYPQGALVTVRGGIPESSDPSYWLEESQMSTIPEFYALIKYYEKGMNDAHNSGDNRSLSLKASYNIEYHYPHSIITKVNGDTTTDWSISLMPLEEGELDIDIGDYENQWEAWNNQNMLDYKIMMKKPHGSYGYDSFGGGMNFIVKNGISDRSPMYELRLKQGTVPGIYAFIKEEEERIRNVYNGINRSYLQVKYHTVYHYPIEINSGVGHNFGSYERWEIMLIPGETE